MTIRGIDSPPTVWHQDQTLQANILNPTRGVPEVGVEFLAPSSGRVLLIYGGQIRDSGGTQQVHLSASVILASGETPPDTDQVQKTFASSPPETQYMSGSQMRIVQGLTPGREYIARMTITTSNDAGGLAATPDVATREIIVVPLS